MQPNALISGGGGSSSSSSSSHKSDKKDKKERDEAKEQAKKEKKATKKLMKELAPCKTVLEEMEVSFYAFLGGTAVNKSADYSST